MRSVFSAAAIIAALLLHTAVFAQKNGHISVEARAQIRQAAASVGMILVRDPTDPSDKEARPRGSAVVVRKDGIVITNYHVVYDERLRVLYGEIYFDLTLQDADSNQSIRRYRLKPILVNTQRDLALLRIVADSDGKLVSSLELPAVELGDSRAVQPLDDLAVIGYPEKGGSTVTVNMGVVEGKDILEDWIKTDARLIHGNSGGAAVDLQGKLIGVPTKVIVDSRSVDKDGDGFPDDIRVYGAVGFLRPSHLVAAMLADLREIEVRAKPEANAADPKPAETPMQVARVETVIVRGLIKSSVDGSPIAGARIGLIPIGSEEVTADNLLTWGGTNADGRFELNKPVPPGRYTIKAKAIRYEAYSGAVEVDLKTERLVIELHPSP